MMTLSEFLLARLAEDEARVEGFWAGDPGATPDFYWGIARIRVECEAKRRIVAEHPMMEARLTSLGYIQFPDGRTLSPYYIDGCCSRCTAGGEYGGQADPETGELDYCVTLLALASVYSDHPDFDPAWRT